MSTFRLLHAAGWNPDAVLTAAPRRVASAFETASLDSLAVLVDRAIELEVDAVVLMPRAGDLPGMRGPSLHAEAVLREQFGRLAPHGITPMIAVGRDAAGWKRLAAGEPHILVLSPGEAASLSVQNGDRQAQVDCVDTLSVAPPSGAASHVLPIVLAPSLSPNAVDKSIAAQPRYIGLGAGDRSTLHVGQGVVHCPGPLQSLGRSTGACGASLVAFDDAGPTRVEPVAVAVLRFESLSVEADPQDELEGLALRMIERMDALHAEACERTWVLRWTVEAAEPLYATLNDPRGRGDLMSLLPESRNDIVCLHEMRVCPHPIWPALDDPFAAEYEAALQEQGPLLRKDRAALLRLPDAMPHVKRLAQLVEGSDYSAVLGDARRFGLRVTSAARDGEDSA